MFASKMSTASHLLLTFLFGSLLLHDANGQGLRRSVDLELERSLDEFLICHLVLIDGQYEGHGEHEIIQCLTDNGMAYVIDLPSDFLEAHSEQINEGSLYVRIPGGIAIDDDNDATPDVFIPDPTLISVVDGFQSGRRRHLAVTGTHNVLVVRITTTSNEVCTPSSNDLAGSVFGLGSAPLTNTMVEQYRKCSYDQLNFVPATGYSGINNGVLEVTVDSYFNGQDTVNILNKLSSATMSTLGVNSLDFDHVMYCIPYGTKFGGTMDWLAFAYIGGSSSFFNDEWCDRLTCQMHEIGHNLGFHHSNEITEYKDQTCLMGYSYAQRDGPLMSFNGFKSYKLGWYADKFISIDPEGNGSAWTGSIAGVVHYEDANVSAGQYVGVNVGDMYLVFNRATGFNAGTEEKQNEVTVVKGTIPSVQSYLVAGLSKGDTYVSENIVIEVCDIKLNTGLVDYAKVSIHTQQQGSTC